MAQSRGISAAEVDFRDHREAQPWFERQSQEVSIVLAVRMAMRVLPLIETTRIRTDFAPHVVLPVLRACFVAWVVAEFPSQRDHLWKNAHAAAGAASNASVDADLD